MKRRDDGSRKDSWFIILTLVASCLIFSYKELIIVISIVTIEILDYRWIVNRMPVHWEHPQYSEAGVERTFK